MHFDRFGVFSIALGAVLLYALYSIYYHAWSAMLLGILLGAVSSFAIVMMIIGLLLLIL